MLRTKTQKALATINSTLPAQLEAVIENFVNYNAGEAYRTLLSMKMCPEEAGKLIGLEEIPAEHIMKVCGDMAAAYKENHPECWLTADYDENFSRAFNGDLTILRMIDEKCREFIYTDNEEFRRALFLLKGTVEKFRYGGLRAIGMSANEAQFLKENTEPIANYLESLAPEKLESNNTIQINADIMAQIRENQPSDITDNGMAVSDVAKEDVKEKATEKDVEQVERKEEPAEQEKQKVSALTPLAILTSASQITSFFAAYDAAINAGLDPQALLEKRTEIMALLETASKL